MTKTIENSAKIILLGNAGVGKTSMLSVYRGRKFHSNYMTTIGIDFVIKYETINNIKYKLAIWDTAGQERYKSISSNYIRGANGIILLIDLNKKESIKNVEHWYSEISKYNNVKKSIILVGAKNDLEQKIPQDEIDKWCIANKIQYMTISAKNDKIKDGKTKIKNVFRTMVANIQNDNNHKIKAFELRDKTKEIKLHNNSRDECCIIC